MSSSKWGSGHPKAIEKRERNATAKNAAQAAKQQAKEDAYWHDDDKTRAKKENRAEDREAKRQAEIDKKAELKKLADEEMAQFTAKPTNKNKKYAMSAGSGGKKLTKAQIAMRQAREELAKEEERRLNAQNKGGALIMVDQEEDLQENINRAEQERIETEGIVEARSVGAALIALDPSSATVDAHPEKRVKSAYKKFEEERYPVLKAENPSLKMSGLRQMIKKEWKKSPLNPMNQWSFVHAEILWKS